MHKRQQSRDKSGLRPVFHDAYETVACTNTKLNDLEQSQRHKATELSQIWFKTSFRHDLLEAVTRTDNKLYDFEPSRCNKATEFKSSLV